jgi:type I restriction-modification system DNA methylase subunit
MGQFVKGGHDYLPVKKMCLEPSAGNGMLTIGLPKSQTRVNDIDEMRLDNLAKQGFLEVTSQDGTQPFEPRAYDVIVTNPPFGAKIPINDRQILEQFDLAHTWSFDSNNGWQMSEQLRSSVPPEQIFIERIIQLLKPGGRAAIVFLIVFLVHQDWSS